MAFPMQLKLFAKEASPLVSEVATQAVQIGPIRFAATPTSYPHLCRVLAALTANEDESRPEKDEGKV